MASTVFNDVKVDKLEAVNVEAVNIEAAGKIKASGGIEASGIYPVLTGTTAPGTSTKGAVGQMYLDTTAGKLYICKAASTTYTWKLVATLS